MADGKADGGTEKMMGWAMILVLLGVCAYVIYRANTAEILNFVRWFRYGEMWLISLITPDNYVVKMVDGSEANLKEWMQSLASIPKERIDFNLITAVSAVALIPYRWAIIAIISLIGLWAYTKGPGTQYTEVFNLDRFIKFQAKAFPYISPFVEFNPSKQPPRAPGSPVPAELPIFAEALGPEEWLAYCQIPVPDGVIEQQAAFKAFARQLGQRWKGAKNLAPHKQILLAACCLKAARKRDASDKMLGKLAMCWSHDKGLQLDKSPGLLREARKILSNKEIAGPVLKKCNQHAWETTAMLRGLLTAREEGGVMAPSQFVWLRAHERELWYPMNNLGRQSHHIEAIGAMVHFRMERRTQRPIPKPKVQEAVRSIVEYMASIDARPIPTLDYSNSKNKRGIKKLKQA